MKIYKNSHAVEIYVMGKNKLAQMEWMHSHKKIQEASTNIVEEDIPINERIIT